MNINTRIHMVELEEYTINLRGQNTLMGPKYNICKLIIGDLDLNSDNVNAH